MNVRYITDLPRTRLNSPQLILTLSMNMARHQAIVPGHPLESTTELFDPILLQAGSIERLAILFPFSQFFDLDIVLFEGDFVRTR